MLVFDQKGNKINAKKYLQILLYKMKIKLKQSKRSVTKTAPKPFLRPLHRFDNMFNVCFYKYRSGKHFLFWLIWINLRHQERNVITKV